MSRNRVIIILAGTLILIVAGGFIVLQNTKKPAEHTAPQIAQPVQPSPSGIMYDANGKLDTSSWQEYRSEYGGFSVRAPKDVSAIGCFGHACDPSIWGEHFLYILFQTSINDEAGEVGLSIEVIKKDKGSTLDTWLSDYITSGANQLFDVQKISINGYPTLQFDWQKKGSEHEIVYMHSSPYPNGNTYTSELIYSTIAADENSSSRFLVIDLGDRYAFVSHTLSIDKEALAKSYTSWGYPTYAKQALAIPNDKTLADIYAAILSSFKAFPPTKP